MDRKAFVSKIQSCLDKINKHERTRILIDTSFSYYPRFSGSKSDLKIQQEDFVGFYFLRCALRGVFSAVNYFVASEMMAQTKLYAPAIQSQYTTCFHILDVYLALNGILIVNPAYLDPEKRINTNIEAAKIILTKKSNWKIEPYSSRHKKKWKELKNTFSKKDGVENYFLDLFKYFYRHEFIKNDLPLGNLKKKNTLNKKDQTPESKFFGKVEEFLRRIAEIRNIALYQSFGSDRNVHEALINRDEFNANLLNKKVINFHRFTTAFFDDTLTKFIQLINDLDIYKNPRIELFIAAFTPYLDSPKIKSVQKENIKEKLSLIKEWLHDYSYRKINLA